MENLDENVIKNFQRDLDICLKLINELQRNYDTRLMYGAKINISKVKRTRLLIQDLLLKWG